MCIRDRFKGSESPDNPDALYEPLDQLGNQKTWAETVRNKRAQYYMILRDRVYRTYRAVEYGVYSDPDTLISFSSKIESLSKLRAELCRMPIKPNGNGKFELYTKDIMKSKFNLSSPNLSDAVMMNMRLVINRNIDIKKPRPIRTMGR